MTEDELIDCLRSRIIDPARRIDMKTLPTPRLYPVTTTETVTASEKALGLKLPELLGRLYLEVANGGFGPGSGLLGLADGYRDGEGRTLTETYNEFVQSGWPQGLLPLWDWGDACWSCVDARNEGVAVVTHDEDGATRTEFTLKTWLEEWVQGVDLFAEIYEFEDTVMLNPFTRQPIHAKRRGKAKGEVEP